MTDNMTVVLRDLRIRKLAHEDELRLEQIAEDLSNMRSAISWKQQLHMNADERQRNINELRNRLEALIAERNELEALHATLRLPWIDLLAAVIRLSKLDVIHDHIYTEDEKARIDRTGRPNVLGTDPVLSAHPDWSYLTIPSYKLTEPPIGYVITDVEMMEFNELYNEAKGTLADDETSATIRRLADFFEASQFSHGVAVEAG